MRSQWKIAGILAIIFFLLCSVPFMSNAEHQDELDPCENLDEEGFAQEKQAILEELDCEEERAETDDETEAENEDTDADKVPADETDDVIPHEKEESEDENGVKEKEEHPYIEDDSSSDDPISEDNDSYTDEKESPFENDETKVEDNEDSNTPDVIEVNQEEQTDGKEEDTEDAETEVDIESEQPNIDEGTLVEPVQTPGLIDVGLLTNTSLDAEHVYHNEKHLITLKYRGYGLLELGLFSNTYSIFHLPSELRNVISAENLSATYDVPALGILIPILRNRGNFSSNEIMIEENGNQVYMNFFNLLSLNLLSYTHYEFTLTIELEEMPPSRTGEYVFYAGSTSDIVDVSILSDETVARATLTAPLLPDPPQFNGPFYTTDTIVTGTGEPNTTINLRIGNQTYTGAVDAEGNFSVPIPEQPAGTQIHGVIVNEQGYESEESSVIVLEPPDTTPPDAPLINPVYSNDTVVTGTGEANTAIRLTINDETYEGMVDENENYEIEIPVQTPETMISAVLIDEAGNESEPTEVTVIEATIAFYRVPENLSFQSTTIKPGTIRIPREDPDWSLEVIDTRGAGSTFRILAEADEPLKTADETHMLEDALVHVDENSTSHPLSDGPITVYDGSTGNQQFTTISWEPDEGPFVEVDTGNVYAEDYSTTITWTLVDAP